MAHVMSENDFHLIKCLPLGLHTSISVPDYYLIIIVLPLCGSETCVCWVTCYFAVRRDTIQQAAQRVGEA